MSDILTFKELIELKGTLKLNEDGAKAEAQSEDVILQNALRHAVISEEKAIIEYSAIADMTDDTKVKKVLMSIANEEKRHIGEINKVLTYLNGDEFPEIVAGVSEE